MDVRKLVDHLDRSRMVLCHSGTIYSQALFGELRPDEVCPGVFAYAPGWGVLDPGMTMEAHEHPIAEFYVFASGKGRMRLGDTWFDVEPNMSVNIPPGVEHELANDATSPLPLVFVSVGLRI
ncbi:MAG TPA: cupin domain-containing protein [Candidatus Latescibacteria bacterium]|nr:cupin domain-containing protein [Candidatus Latescibacterota bacterium]